VEFHRLLHVANYGVAKLLEFSLAKLWKCISVHRLENTLFSMEHVATLQQFLRKVSIGSNIVILNDLLIGKLTFIFHLLVILARWPISTLDHSLWLVIAGHLIRLRSLSNFRLNHSFTGRLSCALRPVDSTRVSSASHPAGYTHDLCGFPLHLL